MRRLNPPQILVISFLCVIAAGTAVLSLPRATVGPYRMSLVDSLFTATSAVCVTGLTVWDTGTTFTQLGRWAIFAMFQAGGLGIMTFSTLFAVLLGRKIGFFETDVIKRTLDGRGILGLDKLVKRIIGVTLAVEAAGALILFARWKSVTGWSTGEVLQNAVFHSVSGFCNAGFSLFKDSLSGFAGDPFVTLTMIFLIFAGGIGFVVIFDLMGLFNKKGPRRRLSLQSKIVLSTSAVLIAAGTAAVFLFERENTLSGRGFGESILTSIFQAVTARTAGFNTLPIGMMIMPTLIVLVFLMFVGASPGSAGGGIKTCTFAVLTAMLAGLLKNSKRTVLFGRSVSRKVLREALAIFFLAASWIFSATVMLAYFERNNPVISGNLMNPLFEVVSAFGTVGLSTGITPSLSDAGKICLTLTMFAGRLGPLTLALAVAFKERTDRIIYPEENIMVG